MSGINPGSASGGVVVRDAAGSATNPGNVFNAYSPPAAFVSTEPLTALPSDCTAKLLPADINAFRSELLSLMATLSPTGPYNAGSLSNLSTLFTKWVTTTLPPIINGAIAATNDKALTGLQSYDPVTNSMVFAMSDGTTVAIDMTTLIADALASVDFCTIANAQAAKAGGLGCLVSANAGQILKTGTDGKLLVPSSAFMANALAP